MLPVMSRYARVRVENRNKDSDFDRAGGLAPVGPNALCLMIASNTGLTHPLQRG